MADAIVVRHRTDELAYRRPFGATPTGTPVRLALDVDSSEQVQCFARLWVDGEGESLVAMDEQCFPGDNSREGVRATRRFACSIERGTPAAVWYTFIVRTPSASYRYGACDGRTCGEGVLVEHENPPSFLLSVYAPRDVEPSWYANGLVYQIFPDRFARGCDWRLCAQRGLARERCCNNNGPKRRIVEDWDTPPSYDRDGEGRVLAWDFYGGTLSGIREKLPYLESLGVTALYLNPIFEAASNHRYDTADYLHLDPMLGDDAAFGALCDEAREHGISIILDGVFNHVGRDSVYFNGYGNYDSVGAWQSAQSAYRDWFTFDDDGSYASWWGVDDLPEIRADAEGFSELICGRAGVIRHWMGEGARGWRLDVADELPEALIARIKRVALESQDDAVLIGEVWEDASMKVSYGKLRHYFSGEELDGAMGYPLRAQLISFLLGKTQASAFAQAFEQLIENYPPFALRNGLNFLGTHDRTRILTVLANAPDPDSLDDVQRASYRLSPEALSLAKTRFWQAVLFQMCAPGVPCIYYGDEAGLQGYTDPYNRASYPWGHEDADCMLMYRNAIGLRKMLPELTSGDALPFAVDDDVFGLWRAQNMQLRTPLQGSGTCLLLNRSACERTVSLRFEADTICDAIADAPVSVEAGEAVVRLGAFGASVLVLRNRADCPGRALQSGTGVLCHITSVPAQDGVSGRLGGDCESFVDWLADAGFRYWQILPVNPTDAYGSPYAGLSAFAGNIDLVPGDVRAAKLRPCDEDGYRAFCAREAYWLDEFALHRAIQKVTGEQSWRSWPERYRSFNAKLALEAAIAPAFEGAKREQYAFQVQWDALRAAARERGVAIVGDMPMYVSADAADVWAHPAYFSLDADGGIALEAGAPPDAFAKLGQSWGVPVYNWEAIEQDGFQWWVNRLKRAFELYDVVRLDHFIGFATYYCIERGKRATEGFYRYGPGMRLFDRIRDQLGALPIIAENLGTQTPAVAALLAASGFHGVDVVQFYDGDVREGYRSADNAVAYTSTHDNQTLVGWCAERFGQSEDDARAQAAKVIDAVFASDAPVRIVSLQDAIGLGDEARMNTPGTTEGNWKWRCAASDLSRAKSNMSDHLRGQHNKKVSDWL